MKRFQMSENMKRGLGVLNKICMTMLIFTFIGLVDVWFVQDRLGDFNTGYFEKQLTGDNLTASDYTDTVEEALLRETGKLDSYQCKIDEEIFRIRSNDFMVIYYRAVGAKEEAFIYAKFRILEQDNQEKYGLVMTQLEVRRALDKSAYMTAKERIYYQAAYTLTDKSRMKLQSMNVLEKNIISGIMMI